MGNQGIAAPEAVEAGVWKDVALLLLGAAADHAVHCGDGSVECFRRRVRDAMEGLQNATESAQILMNAGGVAQAVAHHAAQTQQQVDALLADMKETAGMFLNHMESLHRNVESQAALVTLRSTVDDALREAKLGVARDAILQSLNDLSKLAGERRAQALQLSSNLQDRITVLEVSGPIPAGAPADPVDSCTGLPTRCEAESALTRAIGNHGRKSYAAVFYLHRMPLTNARFGEAIGNQVVLSCSQHVASMVTGANDALFRWSGPAFVAILERDEPPLAVHAEIQRLTSSPFSRFFETPARSVYLPVKITAELIPLFDSNYPEVVGRVESFILKTSGQGVSD